MPDICRLSLAELVEGLGSPAPGERFSALAGAPLVAVDLADTDTDAETGTETDTDTVAPALIEAVATLPCALVGVDPAGTAGAPVHELFDVLLSDDGTAPGTVACPNGCQRALDDLAHRAERWPHATAALAVLLRRTRERSALDGLVAESTTYATLQAGPEFAAWRASRPARVRPLDPSEAVLVERHAATLRITLNRPARHNAYGTAMRDALAAALELAVADDDIGRVELHGAGPSFSSGGDLDEFGSLPDPATGHLVRLTRSPARLLIALAAKVEVHLHGACVGAGIELPAFAARVVAAPDARIRLPELELGLVPGAGGTVSLPRRIGRHRTAYLALSGATIGADTALAWGLVDAIE